MFKTAFVLFCLACAGYASNPSAAWQSVGRGKVAAPTSGSSPRAPVRSADPHMQEYATSKTDEFYKEKGMKMSIDEYEGAAQETNNQIWDPLGLAKLGSPATLAWFRHAEIKHGRVSMAAFVGWLVAASGTHLPGQLSYNQVPISFAEISKLGPMEQWEAVPELGKLQIILAIGIIEHNCEWKMKPHYMRGGTPGSYKHLKYFWDPLGFTNKMSEEKLKRQRLAELKNGRLAMFGIIGCLIGGNLPGSIPAPINWPAGPSFVMPFGPLSTYQN